MLNLFEAFEESRILVHIISNRFIFIIFVDIFIAQDGSYSLGQIPPFLLNSYCHFLRVFDLSGLLDYGDQLLVALRRRAPGLVKRLN